VAIVYGYLSQIASTGSGLPAMPDWFAGVLGNISDDSNTAVWRYTLMSGLIPAIPLILIRPFLPESPVWQKKKDTGQLKRPSLSALFAPQFKRTTIIITLLFALAYGGAFGALQHMRLILPKAPEVAADSTAAKTKAVAAAQEKGLDKKKTLGAGKKAFKAAEGVHVAHVTKVQEVGGLFGRALMAMIMVIVVARGTANILPFVGWSVLAVFLICESIIGFGLKFSDPNASVLTAHLLCLGKGILFGGILGIPVWWLTTRLTNYLKDAPCRSVLRAFQLPGIILMPLIFGFLIANSLSTAYIGVFIAGLLVIGQFTFWGNMLPRYFPVHLRGTGESFAANIGGRLIGTSFAFLVFTITDERWQGIFPQALHGTDGFAMRVAYTTAAIGFFVFALGWFIAGRLPDPQYGNHEDENEDEPKTIPVEDEEETTAPDDENVSGDSGEEKG
jgi:hypothetical protein